MVLYCWIVVVLFDCKDDDFVFDVVVVEGFEFFEVVYDDDWGFNVFFRGVDVVVEIEYVEFVWFWRNDV